MWDEMSQDEMRLTLSIPGGGLSQAAADGGQRDRTTASAELIKLNQIHRKPENNNRKQLLSPSLRQNEQDGICRN